MAELDEASARFSARRKRSWSAALPRPVRSLCSTVACTAALTAGSPFLGAADAGARQATILCEHVAAPGRVRCEVSAQVEPAEAISWGDVVLVQVPSFAEALRGRIGPGDATVKEPSMWRWALALVARSKGRGELRGRVRLVVCREKICTPEEHLVAGEVLVGD